MMLKLMCSFLLVTPDSLSTLTFISVQIFGKNHVIVLCT